MARSLATPRARGEDAGGLQNYVLPSTWWVLAVAMTCEGYRERRANETLEGSVEIPPAQKA